MLVPKVSKKLQSQRACLQGTSWQRLSSWGTCEGFLLMVRVALALKLFQQDLLSPSVGASGGSVCTPWLGMQWHHMNHAVL